MSTWPLQSRMVEFYGNPTNIRHPDTPSSEWESKNLTRVIPPFRMFYAGQPVSGVRIHKRCAMSLQEILETIWEKAGKDQDEGDGHEYFHQVSRLDGRRAAPAGLK